MNKWLLLLIASIATLGIGSFYLCRPDPEKELAKAYHYLSEGNLTEAEKVLSSQGSSARSSLYKAYIQQMRGRFENGEKFLQTAFKAAKASHQRDLLCEISLAEAANRYCLGDEENFHAAVERARTYNSESPLLPFFEGLDLYLQQSYAESLKKWGNETRAQEVPWSNDQGSQSQTAPWMAFAIESLFSPSWKRLHTAHSLIEAGDSASAREILEKESCAASSGEEWLPLNHLLLGLSYLKEARPLPLEQRDSYYKIARFYLERAHAEELFPQEQKRAITLLKEETAQLFLDSQFERAFSFIHLLQSWKAGESIEELSHHFASLILQQSPEVALSLCSALRKEFQGSPFHLLITEKLLATLSGHLKAGESDDLFRMWASIEQLAPSPQMAAKRIAALTSEELFEMVKKDNTSLSRTRQFLVFWEKLNRTPLEREVLARELLIHSKIFWHHEQQEKKGQHLMEIALNLSQHSPYVEREMSHFLTTLFKQAESSNMIGRLLLVYDALEKFQISCQDLISKSTLANYLADADYLYHSRNYSAAKTIATWVLKLEPLHEVALRLAGLASFQMAEYGQALSYLQLVEAPDEESHNALMLSQVFASQEQAKHLCQIDPTETYE